MILLNGIEIAVNEKRVKYGTIANDGPEMALNESMDGLAMYKIKLLLTCKLG